MQKTWHRRIQSLGRKDPLEQEIPIKCTILALIKIPWIGKLGSLQSMRSQRVRQDWAPEQTSINQAIHWNGKQCKRSILRNSVKDKWQLVTVPQILHWENKEFCKPYICIYLLDHVAYEILIPWPWIKSMLAAVKLLNPILWTVREFPKIILKIKKNTLF